MLVGAFASQVGSILLQGSPFSRISQAEKEEMEKTVNRKIEELKNSVLRDNQNLFSINQELRERIRLLRQTIDEQDIYSEISLDFFQEGVYAARCNQAEFERIEEAVDLLYLTHTRIDNLLKQSCAEDRSIPCPEIGMDQILETYSHAYVFCADKNDNGFRGKVMYFPENEGASGAYILYPSIIQEPPCELASTIVHECAHLATGKVHKDGPDGDVDHDDWIYELGDFTEIVCDVWHDWGLDEAFYLEDKLHGEYPMGGYPSFL